MCQVSVEQYLDGVSMEMKEALLYDLFLYNVMSQPICDIEDRVIGFLGEERVNEILAND